MLSYSCACWKICLPSMVNPQPRKTSVPIQFNFAHSKHKSTPSSKETACVLPRIQRYKKRPASIVVPQDTPVHRALPIAVQPVWTRVEITGLSPQLRRADLLELLRNYSISPEFRFPATPQFTRPFRTTILAAGVEEAGRMVKELSGKSVAGRKISVTMSIKSEGEDQKSSETGVHDVAEEWRNNIISTWSAYLQTTDTDPLSSRYRSHLLPQSRRSDPGNPRSRQRRKPLRISPETCPGHGLQSPGHPRHGQAEQGRMGIRGRGRSRSCIGGSSRYPAPGRSQELAGESGEAGRDGQDLGSVGWQPASWCGCIVRRTVYEGYVRYYEPGRIKGLIPLIRDSLINNNLACVCIDGTVIVLLKVSSTRN